MILLNFAHPLTNQQLATIEKLLGAPLTGVRDIPVTLDPALSFEQQVRSLAEAAALSPEEWQTLPILVNPPGLAPMAATLLAELHGRTGHFPAMIRIRPVLNSLPPRFEVAEIINLSAVRDMARGTR